MVKSKMAFGSVDTTILFYGALNIIPPLWVPTYDQDYYYMCLLGPHSADPTTGEERKTNETKGYIKIGMSEQFLRERTSWQSDNSNYYRNFITNEVSLALNSSIILDTESLYNRIYPYDIPDAEPHIELVIDSICNHFATDVRPRLIGI
jgi:hypothetical protein